MTNSIYFTVFGVGIRIWLHPRMWLYANTESVGGRKVREFGPVTVYTGW